jgi:hypothetical protein
VIHKDIFVKLSIITENRRKVEDQEEEEMLQQAIALSLSQEGQELLTGNIVTERPICKTWLLAAFGSYGVTMV